ncbi:hypothetical protein [Actinoplanes couchii]|uniref:Uncharacterized protein n=1 Tax=Actinoplanes couchii TaxID=403638 RepID=A0ABQ3XFX4_9ACTN|nr:hypothetical protein [Actinoplanes couchii]MDR6320885.1 hypothetical protein [Actinoplanes couchii]GID57397.1 hypothetical protein Aco03nite_058010 [Actinoplanes couchii]
MEDLFCSRSDGTLGLQWFWDLLTERGGGPAIDDLNTTVLCCGAAVTLHELRFRWPIGFARFELIARNGVRAEWELDDAELAAIGEILGHPVTQVHARY